MSMLKVSNFLVVDSGVNLRSIRVSKDRYRYTEEGNLLYAIGGVVPVIVRSQGCIGVAVVKSLLMDEVSTTIEFEFRELGKEALKVLYSLYRNNTTMLNDNTDPYNQDIAIPGAAAAPQVNLAEGMSNDGYGGKGLMNDIFNTLGRGTQRTQRNKDLRNETYDFEDDY